MGSDASITKEHFFSYLKHQKFTSIRFVKKQNRLGMYIFGGSHMISGLIGSMLQGILSKKNISINKKSKLLRNEDWCKTIINKHGNILMGNY